MFSKFVNTLFYWDQNLRIRTDCCPDFNTGLISIELSGLFEYKKMPCNQYRNSHYDEDQMVSWLSDLYNMNPYTKKDGLYIKTWPKPAVTCWQDSRVSCGSMVCIWSPSPHPRVWQQSQALWPWLFYNGCIRGIISNYYDDCCAGNMRDSQKNEVSQWHRQRGQWIWSNQPDVHGHRLHYCHARVRANMN